MAQRSSTLVFVFLSLLLSFSGLISPTHGRKLLAEVQRPSTAEQRLYMAALPKGTVPASTPSKKGHAVTVDEKLVARHLSAVDRSLRSVPSPGIGH